MLILRRIQTIKISYRIVLELVRVEVGCKVLTISQSMTGYFFQRRFVFQKWIELNLISVADPRGALPVRPPSHGPTFS